ncbi:MAG: hypothetical protein ACOCVC_07055 [Spirochaeta sp.]
MKPRIVHAIHYITLILLILVTAAGCDFGDPFSGYRGVNLLPEDAQDFSFDGDQADWAWQPFVYDATADAEDPDTAGVGQLLAGSGRGHLLVFEDATAAGGAGAARLEVPNLMPNGDFETGLSGDWTTTGFTSFATQTAPTGLEINQNVLHIDSNEASDRADFTLNNLNGGLPPIGARLFVRFSIRSSGTPTLLMQLHNSVDANAAQTISAGGLVATDDPLEFPSAYFQINEPGTEIKSQFAVSDSLGTTHTLSLPAGILDDEGTILDGSIDNLRFGRTDTRSYIRTIIPAQLPETGHQLLSGEYRLSFEVRRDPTADLNDPGKEPNRFPARRFSVEAFAVGSSTGFTDGLTPVGHDLPDWSNAADWSTISFDFPDLQIPSGLSPDDQALEIRIYANDPTDFERTIDIGSFLIRNPRLEFIP